MLTIWRRMRAWLRGRHLDRELDDEIGFLSKEFFQVFGVQPAFGSAFGAEHDPEGGPNAAMLSHGLWTRLFGGNPSVVGTSLSLGAVDPKQPFSLSPRWTT